MCARGCQRSAKRGSATRRSRDCSDVLLPAPEWIPPRPPRRYLQRLRKESRLPAWQDLGDPRTTRATCRPRRASPRCSSPSSPNATKEGPWASPPTWSTRSGAAFANPMATDAAIDRGVRRTIILEFDVPSYHTDAAQQRGQEQKVNPRVRSIGIHRQLRQVHCL